MKQLFFLLVLFPLMVFSQKAEPASGTQWWLGLRAGINTTNANVSTSYSVLETSNSALLQKEYTSRLGYFIGIEADFDLFGIFEIVFIPGIREMKYTSITSYNWIDSLAQPVYELELASNYDLVYFEVPLLLKYDFVHPASGGIKIKGKSKKNIRMSSGGGLIAYVQGGVFYNRLLSANTTINKTVMELDNELTSEYAQGVKNLFLANGFGWSVGGGVGYDFQSMRVELDVNYRSSFHNMANVKNRYSENILLNDYYEVVDDLKFSNLAFAVRVLFPFKFVYSGSFKKI